MASDSSHRRVYAGDRESGVPCVKCGSELQAGERTVICRSCGGVHHEWCWEQTGICSSYECSAAQMSEPVGDAVPLQITDDDLASAVPLPVTRDPWAESGPDASRRSTKKPWNRTALWAFIFSLLGIPLFGLVTGIVAIVLGCIALVLHTANRRGMGLAVIAILIGLADVLGWAVGLHHFLGERRQIAFSLDEFSIDPESLDELPEHIGRALRANVLIQSRSGFGLIKTGIGSGVVLRIHEGSALIVTNRHVVDHDHFDAGSPPAAGDTIGSTVLVKVLGQSETPGKVIWVAPHGVDLALIRATVTSVEAQAAHWRKQRKPHIGQSVFAIGNPHGLGWTHTAGEISQLRRQSQNTFTYHVIQTSAAINVGSSGGGLYDSAGMLLGINTWTSDKRFAEGLGFSIAFASVLDLIPARYGLPENHPEEDAP